MTEEQTAIVPVERVQNGILVIRGQKVIIDADLANLYGVPTKRLNEQVGRNQDRFPEDFMFQLTEREKQEVVAICDHLKNFKFSPSLPYAFTEHGAIMAASVLNSARAVQVSVFVVRAFAQLRLAVSTHRELADKLQQLEAKVQKHDKRIGALITAIRQLLQPPADIKPKKPFGFHSKTKLNNNRDAKNKSVDLKIGRTKMSRKELI
jgi:hypothetical protein